MDLKSHTQSQHTSTYRACVSQAYIFSQKTFSCSLVCIYVLYIFRQIQAKQRWSEPSGSFIGIKWLIVLQHISVYGLIVSECVRYR